MGISTKTPTWGWIIRSNQILGAGSGLYLGDSDGTQPFLAGLIEHNLIKDTIGYNMEIKHQISLPSVSPLSGGPPRPSSATTFSSRTTSPAPSAIAPHLLAGEFPSLVQDGGACTRLWQYFFHNHSQACSRGPPAFLFTRWFLSTGRTRIRLGVHRSQNGPLKGRYASTTPSTARGEDLLRHPSSDRRLRSAPPGLCSGPDSRDCSCASPAIPGGRF